LKHNFGQWNNNNNNNNNLTLKIVFRFIYVFNWTRPKHTISVCIT
jgi:hypothetical protein